MTPANSAVCAYKASHSPSFRRRRRNVLGKAKTGGGMSLNRLGKLRRSSSKSEEEVQDADYKLKVIDVPLVEQTWTTRIRKGIEASKDKTEY